MTRPITTYWEALMLAVTSNLTPPAATWLHEFDKPLPDLVAAVGRVYGRPPDEVRWNIEDLEARRLVLALGAELPPLGDEPPISGYLDALHWLREMTVVDWVLDPNALLPDAALLVADMFGKTGKDVRNTLHEQIFRKAAFSVRRGKFASPESVAEVVAEVNAMYAGRVA